MARLQFIVSATIFSVIQSVPLNVPYYKPLSGEQVARLASWDKTSVKQNIWQLSGQTQGDMVLVPWQRNGLVNEWFRWTNNEIPYELDPIFNETEANQIHEALKTFAAVSCVNVRPRTPEDVDYVYVTGEDTGCWSYVGRLRGAQFLNLQRNGCIWDHIIIHEFLHAAGFYHEQSSTERDEYVRIMWENITPGTEHNFDKYESDIITNFGEPYDYQSVMHYDAWAFSSNGEPTIVPNDSNYLNVIGRGWEITYSVPVPASYYKPLSEEQASRLASWSKQRQPRKNIWELSGQTEGDMILRPGQRNGLVDLRYRWSNNVIPYELAPNAFNEAQTNQINRALERFAEVSCVTVRPRTADDVDYVYVTGANSGCWSYVGRLGGGQTLNLQPSGCIWDDIIIHEFLHAAGFYHQQSSTERDDYVTIVWENITPGMEHNFDKFGPEVITNFGQPYDYYSIMHYDAWAFSFTGQPTIIPHDISFLNIIGQTWQWGEDMSEIDINKLNLMYCQ
ncbi:hypothetical protein Trydic_g21440 [Trypoxylus dichotomus]